MAKLTDYELSLTVINTTIDKGIGTIFTADEIEKEILNKGGILRVGFGVSPRMYFQDLAALGILEPIRKPNEITYKVVALGIEAAEAVVANRKHAVAFYEDPFNH